uniref:Uncharacterized protein n=1 Tax=Triticum urartu TaxID=4572 RepID=A0A8R7PEA3_TRIUA
MYISSGTTLFLLCGKHIYVLLLWHNLFIYGRYDYRMK